MKDANHCLQRKISKTLIYNGLENKNACFGNVHVQMHVFINRLAYS